MNIGGFAASIGGEMVAGCVIATVDGKRQYVYRDGQFTPRGRAMYNAWTNRAPDMAIAKPNTRVHRKWNKHVEVDHG